MTPPRWFYVVVAACLVTLTAAGLWSLLMGGRYVIMNQRGVLDTHTGRVCYPSGQCYDLGTSPASRPAPTR